MSDDKRTNTGRMSGWPSPWPPMHEIPRPPRDLNELRTKADVERYRAIRNVPADETCPRWLDCNCRFRVAERGESTERCGAVQRVWGHSPYCVHCGALL